jgi:hypothetical protein
MQSAQCVTRAAVLVNVTAATVAAIIPFGNRSCFAGAGSALCFLRLLADVG